MRRAVKQFWKNRPGRRGNRDGEDKDVGPASPAPNPAVVAKPAGDGNSATKHVPKNDKTTVTDKTNVTDKTDQHPLAYLDLWADAYQNLKANEEHAELLERFEKYIADGQVASLDEDAAPNDAAPGSGDSPGEERLKRIQGIANRKLDELCSSDTADRLSFSIGGKPVIVRDVIRKVVTAISASKSLISAAVSAEPHASVVWAGVMTILPFLENVFQQDADAADGLTNLVFLLLRYQVVQKETLPLAFRSASRSKGRHELLLDIKSKMIRVYEEAYLYQMRFVRQYARGRVIRILRSTFTVDNWKSMWTNIESTSRLIDKGLKDCTGVEILTIGASVSKLETKAGLIHDAVLDGNRANLLRELDCAGNALFDSRAVKDTENPCLEGTRLNVLNLIQAWADDPYAEPVYWLQGMAGTGKSSVSLTVAKALKEHRPFAGGEYATSPAIFLGGSFFFKQVDATRNTTSAFYTTIASQLAHSFPDLMIHITDYVKSSLAVGTKQGKEQFNHLILNPVSMVDRTTFLSIRFIIIIDALDECVDLKEVEALLGMLEDIQTLYQVQLRFFVTSRADDHIVKGFESLPRELYRKSVLEKIQYQEGKMGQTDDITRVLVHELSEIAKRWRLPQNWISDEDITKLSKKADGLFIYAATTCRLLDTKDVSDSVSRQELLSLVLEDATDAKAPQQKIDEIYRKVLRFHRLGFDRAPPRKRFFTLMKKMLGFIVAFFEPVSASSLAKFLSVEKFEVDDKLQQLHAVISVSEEEKATLKVLHLSFRDFLLSEDRAGSSFFTISAENSVPVEELAWWIEESSMHRAVFERCLGIMSQELRQDICHLVLPGSVVSDIDPKQVESHISPALQYACCYWARHLLKLSHEQFAEVGLRDGGEVDRFLREKLLFWLEAMCLIRKSSTAVRVVIQLSTLVKVSESPRLASFLQDARRFVLKYRWILENAPLQLYCSALLFTPTDSELRSEFEHLIPLWITRKPKMAERQTALVSELEGHTGHVQSLAFAPSADLLASGSEDGAIKIWDYNTGTALYELDNSDPAHYVDISPNGRAVASTSHDDKVKVTEFAEGMTRTWSCGPDARIVAVTFSPKDSNILASLSKSGTLQIWDIENRRERFSFEVPEKRGRTLAFSPGGDFIAAGFGSDKDGAVRVWGTEKGEIRTEFRGHSSYITALAISFDGKTVASGSRDGIACF